jgi:hypothetical protein
MLAEALEDSRRQHLQTAKSLRNVRATSGHPINDALEERFAVSPISIPRSQSKCRTPRASISAQA